MTLSVAHVFGLSADTQVLSAIVHCDAIYVVHHHIKRWAHDLPSDNAAVTASLHDGNVPPANAGLPPIFQDVSVLWRHHYDETFGGSGEHMISAFAGYRRLWANPEVLQPDLGCATNDRVHGKPCIGGNAGDAVLRLIAATNAGVGF